MILGEFAQTAQAPSGQSTDDPVFGVSVVERVKHALLDGWVCNDVNEVTTLETHQVARHAWHALGLVGLGKFVASAMAVTAGVHTSAAHSSPFNWNRVRSMLDAMSYRSNP